MQFTIIFAAIATLNMAAASPSQRAHLRALNNLCPGIDSPLCCETDVDGVVDLTCESPSGSPATISHFTSTCAKTGLTAECCTLPLDGDALLCTAVS